MALSWEEFQLEADRHEATAEKKSCCWCGQQTTLWRGAFKQTPDGSGEALCNSCALWHTAVFLRGRGEFDLAKQIERFLR